MLKLRCFAYYIYIKGRENTLGTVKKILLSSSIVALSLAGAACGDSKASSSSKKEQHKTGSTTKPKKTKKDEVYFKDDVLKVNDATIKLLDAEVVLPNSEKDVEIATLVLTYDYMNQSDHAMTPAHVFMDCFEAFQETETDFEELEFAMMPLSQKFDALDKLADKKVKPGATVRSAIAFEILDMDAPVELIAMQGVLGKDLGSKIYRLK